MQNPMVVSDPKSIGHVRNVLFGNQKQANEQNTSVAAIVVQALGNPQFSTDKEAVKAILDYIQKAANSSKVDWDVLPLIVGIKAAGNIERGLIAEVEAVQENPESPKYKFHMGPAEKTDIEKVASGSTGVPSSIEKPVSGENLTLRDRAEIIRKTLLDLTSPAVISEVGQDLALLLTAEAFFKNGDKINYNKQALPGDVIS